MVTKVLKVLIVSVFVVIAFNAKSQLRLGAKMAVNYSVYDHKDGQSLSSSVSQENSYKGGIGPQIGISFDFSLGQHLGIRPELLVTYRKSEVSRHIIVDTDEFIYAGEIRGQFLDLPINVYYSILSNKNKLQVFIGPQVSFGGTSISSIGRDRTGPTTYYVFLRDTDNYDTKLEIGASGGLAFFFGDHFLLSFTYLRQLSDPVLVEIPSDQDDLFMPEGVTTYNSLAFGLTAFF